MRAADSVNAVLPRFSNTAAKGRRLSAGVQLATGPTPGSGLLASWGSIRWVPTWPTYATVIDVELANWYSSVALYCCVNCGRNCRSQARPWKYGLAPVLGLFNTPVEGVSEKPTRISPGVRGS